MGSNVAVFRNSRWFLFFLFIMISISITLVFTNVIPFLSKNTHEPIQKRNTVPELSIVVAANWNDLPEFVVTPYTDVSAYTSGTSVADLIDPGQMSYSYYIPDKKVCKIHVIYPNDTSDFSPIIDDVRYCLFIK